VLGLAAEGNADMQDAGLIAEVGRALWGPAWKGPMAESIHHQKGAVAEWATGRSPVPAGVWSELKELVRRRRHELDALPPRIQQAHDAALQQTVRQASLARRRRR
jgi:hypothetical protein